MFDVYLTYNSIPIFTTKKKNIKSLSCLVLFENRSTICNLVLW